MNAFANLSYREFPVAPELRPFVVSGCDIRAPQGIDQTAQLRILPDACDYLVHESRRGLLLLAGSRDSHEYAALDAGTRITALKLRPGALAAILGQDARAFAAPGPVSIFESELRLTPGQRQTLRAFAEPGVSGMTPAACTELLLGLLHSRENSRQSASRSPHELLASVAGLLRANPEATIGQLAGACGLSVRTFERRLQSACGLSPTRLRSILRFFQSYLLLSRAPERRLTDIAYSAGYSDQAHFIRDFRRFAGVRPGEAKRHPDRWGLNPAPGVRDAAD